MDLRTPRPARRSDPRLQDGPSAEVKVVARADSRRKVGTSVAMLASAALATGFALALWAAPAKSEPAADGDAAAVRGVIENQLDAFARDAWTEAFDYAGPGVRSAFGSAENFSRMVREGYPMVWRPADVTFLDASDEGAYIVQRLRVVDQAGDAFLLRYYLKEVVGVWRIEAVDLERLPNTVA